MSKMKELFMEERNRLEIEEERSNPYVSLAERERTQSVKERTKRPTKADNDGAYADDHDD